jgi:hypothetical protein
VIPAYTWYADPSGALTFVNERLSDYLGLPKDHPLRSGVTQSILKDQQYQAGLTGVKGSIVRKAAVGRSVSNLQNALTTIRNTLEGR